MPPVRSNLPYLTGHQEKNLLYHINELLHESSDFNTSIHNLNITDGKLSPDKQFFIVYYDLVKNDNALVRKLKKNQRILKQQLHQKLNSKRIPKIIFVRDNSYNQYQDINKILAKIK